MKKIKRKPLTPRQQEFVECYERNAGDTLRICRELKITPSACVRMMDTPSVKEQLARNTEKASELIKTAAPAIARLAIDMIFTDELNPKIKATLISDLLSRAGINEEKHPFL